MEYAPFDCCFTGTALREFDRSSRAVLNALGVRLRKIDVFGCCGHPLKNVDYTAAVTSAARNLALADQRNLAILTMCSCCYGNLKNATRLMEKGGLLKEEVNGVLRKEDLEYRRGVAVKHVFDFLCQDVGLQRIEKHISHKYQGLKVVFQFGCQLLRPPADLGTDSSFDTSQAERLAALMGLECVPWPEAEECCGAPVRGFQDEVSLKMRRKKTVGAKEAGADFIISACPFCHLQLSAEEGRAGHPPSEAPSVLFTQLFGLALGIPAERLMVSPDAFAHHKLLLDSLTDVSGESLT